MREAGRYGPIARGVQAIVLLGIVGLGLTMPYQVFGVSPIVSGNAGPQGAELGTHHRPAVDVVAYEEDEFEIRVREDVYKWCGFCHTYKPGEGHLLGPNLYGIFGQPAGSVPNYANYSNAMVEARDAGLVWNDETIADYIHDPQSYMPGTNMIISIGTIDDPAERAAIVNILKKDVMGERVTIEPKE